MKIKKWMVVVLVAVGGPAAIACGACGVAIGQSSPTAPVLATPEPSESVPDHIAMINDAPTSAPPVKSQPSPTETPFDLSVGPEEPEEITPGAFCGTGGATGHYRGQKYTCKGPGRDRWRR